LDGCVIKSSSKTFHRLTKEYLRKIIKWM
jgi:hypothetical protein